MSGVAVALSVLGGGAFTGGISLPQVVIDARLAVLGPRSGRAAEGSSAVRRIANLETETAYLWRENPAGPQAHLAALALAHAAAGEAQLADLFPPEVLEQLRRERAASHASIPEKGRLSAAFTFLSDLRDYRPAIYDAFQQVPATRATFVTALSRSEGHVRFDPTEPMTAPGQCFANGSTKFIRLSSRLRPGRDDHRLLATPVFEAFNAQALPQHALLRQRAEAGTISREEFTRGTAALEQLAHAHRLWTLRSHFRELAGAGLADTPESWSIPLFGLFVPPPPGWHVPVRRYPHGVYGIGYDRIRLMSGTGAGEDVWARSVLLSRIWSRNQMLPGDREWLHNQGERLNRLEFGDPGYLWYRSYRYLPRPVRVWLSTVRGGEQFAAACRAGRVVAGAVAAAVP